MTIHLTKRTAVIATTIAAAAIAFAAWHLQPDRRLHRSWDSLLTAVENRRASNLAALIAADYSDRWGYTRASLVDDARLAFFHFRDLRVRTEQLEIRRMGTTATIVALVRLDAEGSASAAAARARINGLFTPFTFEWRRDGYWLGRWRLVRIDHPQLNPTELRTRASEGW